MTPTPDLRDLDDALRTAPTSDLRFEAAVLALLAVLLLLWLAAFLNGIWEPADMVLLGCAAGIFLVPVLLVPWVLNSAERRLLRDGGFLRLFLPLLLPRRLPWHGPGVLSAAGQTVGFGSAHARLAAAGWRRIQPWRPVPGAWIGRSAGRICVWRRLGDGWILVAARPDSCLPPAQEPAPSRSRP
jgi:hypothetical protein